MFTRNPMGTSMPWVRPAWMPKPFWRQLVFFRNIYLSCGIVAALIILRRLFFTKSPWNTHLFVVYIIIVVGAAILAAWAPRALFARFRGRLMDEEYSLCLECGYCLLGLPEVHNCPECGAAYRLPEVRAAWTHWLTHYRLPESGPPRK